jgi:EAL domain-containing protein (putative c-di-GMP-specific phosphodiesterase class I)/ActR/RegA family two-component response regulator
MPSLLSSQRQPALPPAALPDRQVLASMRVLLLEDDAVQRDLLAAILRHFGVGDLITADDGWIALTHLAAMPFDLVISDLSLPGMDGMEFLHRAAAFDVGAFAIVSAADAAVISAVKCAMTERGAQLLGHLHKPLSMHAVGALLACCDGALIPACRLPLTPAAPTFDLAALGAALDAGQFVPYYQPKLALDDGRLLGVEILARWNHPEAGVLAPVHFIAAMEHTALIDRLTFHLLDRALADAAHWGDAAIDIALNLAPHTMEDPALPDRLLAIARVHGMAPQRITLELTETAMACHPQRVRDCATRLRLRGFRFAIDDFGIGYSSMALLLSLPFNELKIDQSFVASLIHSVKARTMMEAMVALGKRLGMRVVAEGIEDEAQLRLVRGLGCPAGQGYLFSVPVGQAALVRWIANAPRFPSFFTPTP